MAVATQVCHTCCILKNFFEKYLSSRVLKSTLYDVIVIDFSCKPQKERQNKTETKQKQNQNITKKKKNKTKQNKKEKNGGN